MTVHEIWMLFISPANPDFSGQTPSTGKQLQLAKKKKRWKTTEINLAASLVQHTNTRATDLEVNTRKSTLFLPQAGQQTHYYHTQTKIHTHTEVRKDHAYLDRSVFTWRPEGAVKAHKLGYFACTWEPAKHFSLLSVILIAQHDSSALNLPTPPPLYTTPPPSTLARWLFF